MRSRPNLNSHKKNSKISLWSEHTSPHLAWFSILERPGCLHISHDKILRPKLILFPFHSLYITIPKPKCASLHLCAYISKVRTYRSGNQISLNASHWINLLLHTSNKSAFQLRVMKMISHLVTPFSLKIDGIQLVTN